MEKENGFSFPSKSDNEMISSSVIDLSKNDKKKNKKKMKRMINPNK